MSGWRLQDGTGLLNVMALVTEDELDIMHTLDAEVRADVEAAARLLARQLQAHGCVRFGCSQIPNSTLKLVTWVLSPSSETESSK